MMYPVDILFGRTRNMIGDLGAPELLIILAIVILLFGVGKVGRLGKDLGTAVREFRSAVKDGDDKPPAAPPAPEPAAYQPPAQQYQAPGQSYQPPAQPAPPAAAGSRDNHNIF